MPSAQSLSTRVRRSDQCAQSCGAERFARSEVIQHAGIDDEHPHLDIVGRSIRAALRTPALAHDRDRLALRVSDLDWPLKLQGFGIPCRSR